MSSLVSERVARRMKRRMRRTGRRMRRMSFGAGLAVSVLAGLVALLSAYYLGSLFSR